MRIKYEANDYRRMYVCVYQVDMCILFCDE